MEINELEALRDSREVCVFDFPRGGCRGTVVQVGFPADPNAVHIRSVDGSPYRFDARNVKRIA